MKLWHCFGILLPLAACSQPAPPPAPRVLTASTNLTLAWDAGFTNWPVLGYHVYWGPASHFYTGQVSTAAQMVTISNLPKAATLYFAATSFDEVNESVKSAELVYVPPPPLTNRVVTITAQVTVDLTNWVAFTNLASIVFTNPPAPAFYRLLINERLQ